MEYYDLTMWPAPFGLIAQLAEHCRGIAEVMGAISSPNLDVLGPISLQRSLYKNNESHTASTNMR